MSEISNLFKVIGYDGDNIEGAIEHLRENYIERKSAHMDERIQKQFEGKTLNAIKNKIKSIASNVTDSFDVDGSPEDALTKLADVYSSKIDSLSNEMKTVKEKSKEGQAKQVIELQSKVEDYEKSLKDFETQNRELLRAKDELESNFNNQIKDYKIQTQYKDYKSKVPFADKVDLDYFDWKVKNSFHFDLSDTDHLVIKDKDGHLIKSKEKAGAFMSPEEALKNFADEMGVLKKNDVKKPVTRFETSAGRSDNGSPNVVRQPKRKLQNG